MSDNLLQQIYSAFDPALPLSADQTDLYVELDKLRGDTGTVRRMTRKISLAQGRPTCQVLAGHRGSGKTTELRLLQRELEREERESGTPKMFVVFFQADEDLDRNDVDFPDLLVAIVRQLAAQLHERAGIKLKPGYFKDRLQRLGGLLSSEVDFDDFTLDAGLASLGATIKGSPDARVKIREAMEPDTGNLLKAANDLISEAVAALTKKEYGGLVVIVDDLDKMVVRPMDHAGCSSAEYLFVHRAAQLTAFNCHVVYSMPISLAYSHQENAIKSNYGGHVPVVPMTKIATKPPNSKPHEPGIAKFREMVKKRLAKVGATEKDLVANDTTLKILIGLSGGQPSELMTLVRESIIAHGLPIDDASLDRARREGQREYARQLRAEHWPIIEAVRETGVLDRTKDNEPLFHELLESRAILQYVNDEEWYGLNPMVEPLRQPAKPRAAKATPKHQ